MLFDNLDLPDRASLALTCKPIASKLDFCGLLSWDTKQMARLNDHYQDPVADLLKVRLGKGWFPKHLKYCCKCGKYVPRCLTHWRNKLFREFSRKGGTVGQKYRRWRHEVVVYGNSSTILETELLRWCDPKPQTCPRCKLLA